MARKIFDAATLRITFVAGYDEFGKVKTAAKNFGHVKEDAPATQLEQFVAAYAALSTQPHTATIVTAQHTIVE